MPLVSSITDAQVMTALGNFLVVVLPDGTPVIQGQANRVAEPGAESFVMMTPSGRVRLATNTDSWDETNPAPTTMNMVDPTRYSVQLDFHGEQGADNAQVVKTTFRDDYACQFFAATGIDIQPLWSADPVQAPFINGEDQYEDRWTMNVEMQINPVISTPMQFAASLTVVTKEVETQLGP